MKSVLALSALLFARAVFAQDSLSATTTTTPAAAASDSVVAATDSASVTTTTSGSVSASITGSASSASHTTTKTKSGSSSAAAAAATGASYTVPSGISSDCSSFLNSLNTDATLGTCTASLLKATSSFSSGSQSQSSLTSALNNLCAASGCSDKYIRTQLTQFASACSDELDPTSGVKSVLDTYDLLYIMQPFQDAICQKNDDGTYCALEAPSSTSNSTSSGSSDKTGASVNAVVSSTDADVVDDAIAQFNGKSTSASGSLKKRDQTVIDTSAYRSSGVMYLYTLPTLSAASLCTDCVSKVLAAYAKWESTVPYAIGLSNSPMLGGQGEIWTVATTPSPVTQIFGMNSRTVATCSQCRAATERSHSFHVVDLNYPRKQPHEPAPAPPTSISEFLTASLQRNQSYRSTCQSCKQSGAFVSKRSIHLKSLPPVLSVNAAPISEESLKIWRDRRGAKRFLSTEINVKAPDGAVEKEVRYKLRAVVFQVRVTPEESHLVAAVRVPDSGESRPKASPWYLFNDFVVQNISEDEALGFPSDWKVPCMLFLERQDTIDRLDFSGLPSKLDPTILCRQHSIARSTDWSAQKHKVLTAEELPTPGTVVAIDAEFVALQQEESEYRSDGTKKVIRPSLMTLARVSVLRGQGSSSGTPFMDDYIHTTDTIVNYLTEFSGIRFGDLDPALSRHTLLPLKTVYKKLRLLVDLGCIFVSL